MVWVPSPPPNPVSDYRVIVHRSARPIRQKFWVTIVAANGQTLFHSEQLKSLEYAKTLAHQTTEALDGNFIDLT